MALDGNGLYIPPGPEFPAIPNTVIYAADFNTIINDIAEALSVAIFRDGQAPFEADQSMGGFKLTNVGLGVNPGDVTNVLQVFTDPHFIGVAPGGVQISGTNFQVTTLICGLPAGTTIGTVTNAEIAFLSGLSQNIEGKFDSLDVDLTLKADLISPVFTGNPTAPTPALNDNSQSIATTAFAQQLAFQAVLPAQPGGPSPYTLVTTNGVASWDALDEGQFFYLANN